MKKTIFQGAVTIILFFAAWFVLTHIDWMRVFNIKKVTDRNEERLGEIFWEVIQKTEKEHKNLFVSNSLDSIVAKICSSNQISTESVKVHVIEKDEINAFALPNGHIIVYSGLIMNSDNQEELSGVICHEIAHLELNHVMKKLVKEIGLSVVISMTSGNGGSEIIKEAAKMLSSTAFDRSLEREADSKALDYLIASKIDPEPFANFLYKLSEEEHEATKYLTWISTHPDSKERAEYIVDYIRDKKVDYEPVLADETWIKLKEELTE